MNFDVITPNNKWFQFGTYKNKVRLIKQFSPNNIIWQANWCNRIKRRWKTGPSITKGGWSHQPCLQMFSRVEIHFSNLDSIKVAVNWGILKLVFYNLGAVVSFFKLRSPEKKIIQLTVINDTTESLKWRKYVRLKRECFYI